MLLVKMYKDVCDEIETIEWAIKTLEKEHEFWWSNCFGNGVSPLADCLEKMEKICDKVELYSKLIDMKKETKRDIEYRLGKLSGIDGQVMYMRVVEGKSLQEIAYTLNYSIDWVKKISSRSKSEVAV